MTYFIFNDPQFNCDVYMTEVPVDQIPQRTEPEKQGPWLLVSFENYEQLARKKETTPTHTTYIEEIIKSIVGKPAYSNSNEVQDALFGEAEVYGEKTNILIDS